MTDQHVAPVLNLNTWHNGLGGKNRPPVLETPERRLKNALSGTRQAIDRILTLRANAARGEVDRQSKSSPLSWLLGSFTNPFSPDASTETRRQAEEAATVRFINKEGIIGGRLLERDPEIPADRQKNFLYVDQTGDVIWIKKEGGMVLVTRYQFGTQQEPAIMKIQSKQDPSGEVLPESVSRTMPRLAELEHIGNYLTALADRTETDLYGSGTPESLALAA
jgi:hypothetical protein